jgi:hypothetical protein
VSRELFENGTQARFIWRQENTISSSNDAVALKQQVDRAPRLLRIGEAQEGIQSVLIGCTSAVRRQVSEEPLPALFRNCMLAFRENVAWETPRRNEMVDRSLEDASVRLNLAPKALE